MAESGAADYAPIPYCSVCRVYLQSLHNMKSLRCGHAMCHGCSATRQRPICTQCTASMAGDYSRPQSFAEVNLEMTLPNQHRACEEKAERCAFRGQVKKCQHCNLYLCSVHENQHKQMILDNAADNVRKLEDMMRQARQRLDSNESVDEEYRLFKESAESKLSAITQAVQTLEAAVRMPIATYESHLEKHAQQRDKALTEMEKMLGQLKNALRGGNHEAVLNAQRTFEYMQNVQAYLPAQQECVPRFNSTLDTAAIDGQINVIASALQGLRELRQFRRDALPPDDPPSSAEQLSNRMSCLYMSLGPSTAFYGNKIVTFESPLDIDSYSAGNELVLFVAEANRDESKVTLRAYSEPRMDCKEVPLTFVRNHQLITSFNPRRLAVMADKKLIAMTDVRSDKYCRHIFMCDFTGQGGQKVFRIDKAKKLNGIHASGSRIYVCDTVDRSVFIVDCEDNAGRHKRVACDGSIPYSVSTRNGLWMMVVCGYEIRLFSLDSLLPISGIQAAERRQERQQPVTPEVQTIGDSSFYMESSSSAEVPVQQFRDIVHLSNGNFVASTETLVIVHRADMTRMTSIGGAELPIPGLRLEDLMGMCAVEKDGRVRIFVCDRRQKQISIIGFNA